MIFLSLVCISFCSYSQRLNEDGRKVVSHIDIEYSDGLYYSSLDLYYDDCLRLQSFDFEIDFNNQPDIRITCEKKNGTIIRKDYEDGQISKNFSHEYVLDSRGRIIKRMRYDYAIDGSYILRTDNDMEYDDEDRLYSINTTPWSKLANESSFSQSLNDVGRDDIRYYNPNENGDIVWRRKRGKIQKFGKR